MVAEIKMYELLKSQFGERDARVFAELLQERIENTFEQKQNDMATKKDVALLRDEVITLRADLLRTIYVTSLSQLVAIIGSVVALVFILKK